MVNVISKDGIQVMPTSRYGKIRHLLKEGKAEIVKHQPFTVRLLYETTEFVQPAAGTQKKQKSKMEKQPTFALFIGMIQKMKDEIVRFESGIRPQLVGYIQGVKEISYEMTEEERKMYDAAPETDREDIFTDFLGDDSFEVDYVSEGLLYRGVIRSVRYDAASGDVRLSILNYDRMSAVEEKTDDDKKTVKYDFAYDEVSLEDVDDIQPVLLFVDTFAN